MHVYASVVILRSQKRHTYASLLLLLLWRYCVQLAALGQGLFFSLQAESNSTAVHMTQICLIQ